MTDQEVLVPVEKLERFMVDVFVALGVPKEDAAICADVLIASDLRGIESHGVGRLKMYYDRIKAGIQYPVTDFQVVKETPTTALVDGGHGMGHVIAYHAMQMAIDKAREYGLGAVAVRNSTHFGIDGYYSRMAIKEGMIGLSFTNARPSIAPTFGVQPMLGTNPIAFGAPTDEDCPFLFDGATSITQRGKIEVLDRADKPTPEGWVVDQQGEYATDTPAILTGLVVDEHALLPLGGLGELLGGHKGYGLAAMVEILCASLQDGAYLQDLKGFDPDGQRRPFMLGHFFLAINIASFIPLERSEAITGDIVQRLRASTKAPGQDRIYTAGEKEWEMEKVVQEQGVPVNEALQKNIRTMQRELGLTGYDFPF
ncbi:MAG: Ldh family oxidoreductase [Chloroflexi bacterium]|nr:Ldh family oxidoreductase [Chloroflexota bacterium]MBU1746935.1 Ldh family oxidoreductase [Chloroflexota bacterium]